MNKYKSAKGAMFNDEQAQVIGERIEVLIEENDGHVDPEIILNDAQYKSSPLHDHFEWDDDLAAGKYRTWQARQMVSHIQVVIRTNGDEEPIKAFHNVTITNIKEKTSERVYMSVARVLSDKEYHSQIIDRAMDELEKWRKRYKQYKELDKIFKVIEEVKASV